MAYDRALVLLNQKSEEIKRLEEDLSQQRSENDKLTVQIRDFGQKLTGANAPLNHRLGIRKASLTLFCGVSWEESG